MPETQRAIPGSRPCLQRRCSAMRCLYQSSSGDPHFSRMQWHRIPYARQRHRGCGRAHPFCRIQGSRVPGPSEMTACGRAKRMPALQIPARGQVKAGIVPIEHHILILSLHNKTGTDITRVFPSSVTRAWSCSCRVPNGRGDEACPICTMECPDRSSCNLRIRVCYPKPVNPSFPIYEETTVIDVPLFFGSHAIGRSLTGQSGREGERSFDVGYFKVSAHFPDGHERVPFLSYAGGRARALPPALLPGLNRLFVVFRSQLIYLALRVCNELIEARVLQLAVQLGQALSVSIVTILGRNILGGYCVDLRTDGFLRYRIIIEAQ